MYPPLNHVSSLPLELVLAVCQLRARREFGYCRCLFACLFLFALLCFALFWLPCLALLCFALLCLALLLCVGLAGLVFSFVPVVGYQGPVHVVRSFRESQEA